MSPRRLALVALLGAVLAPGTVRAGIPIAIYPFRVPGLSPDKRADLHGLLEAGVVSASRRGILQPRAPILLPASCGDSPAAPCLAAAARNGLVLAGRGELRAGVVLLTAALYDRNGARTREVRFVADLVIQNLRPVGEALMELEVEIEPDGTVAGSATLPPAARDPRGPAPGTSAAPPPLPPKEPPRPPEKPPSLAAAPQASAAASKRTPVEVSAPAVWKRQAGPLFTIVGGALLAGGAAVALANRSLAEDLEAKRDAGTLTPADLESYDKVDRYNVLSTVLFAAGGISAAAGGYLWITAPPRPGAPALAVAGGRF